MPSNIAKNTSFFTLALIIQKVITFFYFTILARNLDPDYLGKYYLAISITTMFSVLIDIGLSNLLTREVAKVNNVKNVDGGAQQQLSAVMAIKLPLAFLALTIIYVFVNILNYPDLIRHLVYLSAIPMLFDSFTTSFFAVIRGFHNLKYESIASVMYMGIAMFIGLTFLKRGYSLEWIMSALAIASLFYFFYALFSLILRYKIFPIPNWRSKLLKNYFFLTIPFGLFALLQRAFTYLDTVLLSKLASDWDVGLYQIAFKIIFALQFLPMAFIASLYPALASSWAKIKFSQKDKAETSKQMVVTFERAINYLTIISLPISVGVITLAGQIMKVFKPEYASAVLPLQIIMASLWLLFINFPIGALLNACDRQKINTLNMAVALGVSISFNIFLIPMYQATGAALTVFIANATMFGFGFLQVPNIIKLRPMKLLIPFFKALFAALIMGAFIWYLELVINIFILIPLGALVYFAALLAFRGLRVADLMSIKKAFTG
ncbi:MAG: flippase [Patescibacteria group bacterium]|nr:flippase [Patescibacteria group bacterium]